MKQKKFKWTISKLFSLRKSLMLKEQLIDTFARIRLKEGFKCLFQCSKFAVFTMQLQMFDSGETAPPVVSTTSSSNKAAAEPVKAEEQVIGGPNNSSFSASSEQVQQLVGGGDSGIDVEKSSSSSSSSQLLSSSFSEFTTANKANAFKTATADKKRASGTADQSKTPTLTTSSGGGGGGSGGGGSSQYCTLVYVINFMNSTLPTPSTNSSKPNGGGQGGKEAASDAAEKAAKPSSNILNSQMAANAAGPGLLNIAGKSSLTNNTTTNSAGAVVSQSFNSSMTGGVVGGQTPSSASSFSTMLTMKDENSNANAAAGAPGFLGKSLMANAGANIKSSRPINLMMKSGDLSAGEALIESNNADPAAPNSSTMTVERNEELDDLNDLIDAYTDANPELYFTTELYIEAISGVYQAKLSAAKDKPQAGEMANSKTAKSSEHSKDNFNYFKDLTYQQILNLIYLNDLKCFNVIQSCYSFYLEPNAAGKHFSSVSANTPISSNQLKIFYSLLNILTSYSSNMNRQATAQWNHLFNAMLNSPTLSALKNTLNNHISFSESIRLLPDLNLILPRSCLNDIMQAIREPLKPSSTPTPIDANTIGAKRNASTPRMDSATSRKENTSEASPLVVSASVANFDRYENLQKKLNGLLIKFEKKMKKIIIFFIFF